MKALLFGILTFSALAIAIESHADCGEVPPPPIQIVVSGATWNPVTYSYETGVGKTVTFAGYAVGGGIAEWGFEDGYTAPGPVVSHAFQRAGRTFAGASAMCGQSGGVVLDVYGAEYPNSLVIVGAGSAGNWGTALELSDPGESGFVAQFGFGSPDSQGLYGCPALCPFYFAGAPPGGASSISPDVSPLRNLGSIGTLYLTPPDEELPVLNAFAVNSISPAGRISIPAVHLSTLRAASPEVLVFPGASRDAGTSSNLVIANVIPDFLMKPSGLDVAVQAFSPSGDEIGVPASYSLVSGETKFVGDVLGELGVSELVGGQIRITKTSTGGLPWGALAVSRADGSRSVVPGLNLAAYSPFARGDTLVLPGAGALGNWDTEITISNPTSESGTVQIVPGSRKCGDCPVIFLKGNASATIRLSSDPTYGTGVDAYSMNSQAAILPAVTARIFNRDRPELSADIPVVGFSTFWGSSVSELSFPGARRIPGSRVDLFLVEIGGEALPIRIEARSDDGSLLGSLERILQPGQSLFLVDALAQLGVAELDGGQIRVVNEGQASLSLPLLAGSMSINSSDGSFSIVSGVTP